MNLYLLTQNRIIGYDTYDSCVVAAKNEETARNINPDGKWGDKYSSWCLSPDYVDVKLIGKAVTGTEPGVVCASFNAG